MTVSKDVNSAALGSDTAGKKRGIPEQFPYMEQALNPHTKKAPLPHCAVVVVVVPLKQVTTKKDKVLKKEVGPSPWPLPAAHKGPRHHPLTPPAGTCSSLSPSQAAEGDKDRLQLPAASAPEPRTLCLHLGCGRSLHFRSLPPLQSPPPLPPPALRAPPSLNSSLRLRGLP